MPIWCRPRGSSSRRGAPCCGTPPRANLTRAHLAETNLTQAGLTRMGLMGSDFNRVRFGRADLTGAHLSALRLVESDPTWANLVGMDLTWQTSRGQTSHERSSQRRSSFGRTFWEHTLQVRSKCGPCRSRPHVGDPLEDLSSASLTRAILIAADLLGTNLERAHFVTRDDLEKATINESELGRVIFEKRSLGRFMNSKSRGHH